MAGGRLLEPMTGPLARALLAPAALADRLEQDPAFLDTPVVRDLPILFIDLSGFTRQSERLGLARTRELLKAFHDVVDGTVSRHGGLVVNFMGDGALIVFGMLDPDPDRAGRALAAAAALIAATRTWIAEQTDLADGDLDVRVGAHHGPVALARLGSDTNQQITTAGDTVNVASRLLGIASDAGVRLVVGEELLAAAGIADPTASFGQRRTVAIRGRSGRIVVWLQRPGAEPASSGGEGRGNVGGRSQGGGTGMNPSALRDAGDRDRLTEGPIGRPHVLVVDDDPAMQRMIGAYLGEHNIRVSLAADRRSLARTMSADAPDLVVLDIQLGVDDGLDLLRELRRTSVVPVIMITGHRRDEVDRVVGLELGADDYVTKPFSLRELLARIRATLRRRTMDSRQPERQAERTYTFDRWTLNQRRRVLTNEAGEPVPLTKAEYALLSAFVAAPRRPLSREHLLQATRVHEDVFDRSIDVQILRLRRKVEEDPRAPRLIRTERGVGYVLDAEVRER